MSSNRSVLEGRVRRVAWTPRSASRLAWSLFALCVALLAVAGALTVTAPPLPPGVEPFSASAGIFAVALVGFMAVGALIASRVPAHPLGWMLCVFALLMALNPVTYQYAITGLPGAAAAAWLNSWLWMPPIALLGQAMLRFPDGRLPSPRWRWVARSAAAGALLAIAAGVALWPRRGIALLTVGDAYPGLANTLAGVALPLIFGSFVAGAVSLVVRLRGAGGDERQQLKWLVYAAAVTAAGLVVFAVGDVAFGGVQPVAAEILGSAGVLGIPLAVWIAITKHRLYAIDRIISRTVSYALLTGLLVAMYFAGVVLLGALLRPIAGESDLAVAGSTLAVVIVFGPLRRKVQLLVDRRFDRARYDAARTVAAFATRLRHEVDLDTVAADLLGVAHATMQPSAADVWLRLTQESRRG